MPKENQHSLKNEILETQSPNLTNNEVKKLAKDLFGLSGKLFPLDSERDLNFRIDTITGEQYVIKIANSAEDQAVIDMQIKGLEHIKKVDPELPVPRVLYSRNGLAIEQIQTEDGTKHFVRVLTYMQGVPPEYGPTNQALLRPMGASLARLGLALRGFYYPTTYYDLLWDLKHTAKLREYLPFIPEAKNRELVSYFLDRFDQNVLPMIPKLRWQFIHNDMTPDNIIVAENDPGQIAGIIDFGDMTHTPLINDLATTTAQMLPGHVDLVETAVEVLIGYKEIIPLEDAELRLLYDLIAARLLMLIVIACWRVTLHPDNEEYIMGSIEQNWFTLESWRALDSAKVTKKFLRVCGLWEEEEEKPTTVETKESRQSHLARRTRLLGQCAYLFYDQPLHIVRGEGVWLYDIDGNRYLDVYNNVAHVGHCHPHVVNAIAKQSRQLNTNTRYMHGLILELAEQITKTMPDPLSVCMFVCTGTEANELAWRLSKMVSGNSGALITKFTYHGNSAAITQFSTEIIPQNKLPSHVQTVFPPISDTAFRKPDSGIGDAIKLLGENGHHPAMLMLDTAFASDGIYTSPEGYLDTLFTKTRSAGGLCVADEVQGGFGRFGLNFWGFQFDDVIPDIVTLGKPMGNGHPVAAVVTRPEITEVLARETGYFNTYGGNPVSCAAGLAVLEVIEKEGLQDNALEVGNYLKERLGNIKEKYPMIGELHGSGLLYGVDIVAPDGTPDPKLADRMMNHMRENGVLVGTTGPHYSTLKIRPPIVFKEEHADILLASLLKALDEL
jgi:4-aminobutyrate aminotransferase-like enzyme/Ser/Thr protein kinase RdoA (MazF antagonist)